MTAEVVIMNKCAAVLAADSAITIQTRKEDFPIRKQDRSGFPNLLGAIVNSRADPKIF